MKRLLLPLLLAAVPATATTMPSPDTPALPKLELGVALGGQYLADYRGSTDYNSKVLPVPFMIYRGERFKVDRSGVRGDLVRALWWEFNVSGEVSLSGGNDNRLREGMPELDSTFEIGPSLNIALDGNAADDGWLLRVPVRAVLGVSTSGIDYVGWLMNPKLTYVKENIGLQWRFAANLGATYANEQYHDYYYEVAPEYVTDTRPGYNADSGYSGAYFKTSLVRHVGEWRYGVSVRYDNLSGTDFAASSPLVETEDYFAVSFLLAKTFYALDF